MAGGRTGFAVLLILVSALVWAGCSASGDSIDDSQIISALDLKEAGSGYEMNGDPFCRIDDLLNDVDEVNSAADEKGIDFVRFGWLGICAGAGTPQPIINLLHRNLVTIVATPEYRAMIEKAGSFAVSSTPVELDKVITQTLDEVGASIREFGLQQE